MNDVVQTSCPNLSPKYFLIIYKFSYSSSLMEMMILVYFSLPYMYYAIKVAIEYEFLFLICLMELNVRYFFFYYLLGLIRPYKISISKQTFRSDILNCKRVLNSKQHIKVNCFVALREFDNIQTTLHDLFLHPFYQKDKPGYKLNRCSVLFQT